ncbi:hypothetical protein SMICM17S_11202 [Streptomyces microflavus]
MARTASREQLEAVRPVAEEIVTAAQGGDLIAYLESDRRFHLDLLALAGNARLVETMQAGDRPGAEGDRAVPAGRGEAVLVPEEGAEVGPGVVRRHQEGPVHVGVAARFAAQQGPGPLNPGVGHGGCAALSDGGPVPGHGRRGHGHDPERLAAGVPVDRPDRPGVRRPDWPGGGVGRHTVNPVG